ncbi:uncharacterized protein LOC129602016 [Paramacrobiotus metropolitanus]|uniref:uncharacterized protein LOC129586245 n=1 Tax=Paramacrobiotus metropolitanus TaxID=2943436 RepID=UPI0024462376|nr:uncharacterized protein LOC129586245 [Paramacrobiotus metropolitanus]XP_055335322.1 uncharacterized protein LOC129586245 [Paramacrobiotus metropolitanus]XP_055356927.1 uncharacterized protein LOC129602016 [Paramacrobiotus metropolitanus]XP_055356928.1 uncharacterized protein LOC129602016 [Paramacrobiotus metropolitanus]
MDHNKSNDNNNDSRNVAFYVREANPIDLMNPGISRINVDYWTETYNAGFYLHYFLTWPDLFLVAVDPNKEIIGYIMGKVEGEGTNWHSHITALSVDLFHRKCGIASDLMKRFEEVSNKRKAYFCDLYVRVSNQVAVEMYKKMGYVIYRRVLEYYSGDPSEDAFDMRKPLLCDVDRKSVLPAPKDPIHPDEVPE